MLNYISFLFKTLRKKKSVYIISVISFLLVGIMTSAYIKYSSGPTSHLNSIGSFDVFFPFVLASLFSAMIVTHIFKDGQKDGTELMIVAKPITRREIIIGKFIAIVLTILAYQAVQLVGYLSMTTFDKIATTSVKLKWAFSLAVGGFIIQLIISSIIILISSFTSKIGTVVLTVIIASFIPIVSFVLVPMGRGTASSVDFKNKSVATFATSGNDTTLESEENYKIINSPNRFESKYLSKRWYDKVASADIWYQWGRFYSMFTKHDSRNAIVKYDFKKTSFTEKQGVKVKVAIVDSQNNIIIPKRYEEHIYGLAYDFNYKDKNHKTVIHTAKDVLVGLEKLNNNNFDGLFDTAVISSLKAESNLSDRLDIIKNTLFNSAPQSQFDKIAPYHTLDLPIFVYQYLSAKDLFVNDVPIYDVENPNRSSSWSRDVIFLKSNDSKGNIIASKPFISTFMVVTLWSVIGLALMSGAIAIYAKRDFK